MSGQPSSLANGPSQRDTEGEQLWERPWSLDEMRRSSATWSLAADSGLFLYLQDFSQRMLSKTHEIEKHLDGVLRDAKATDCYLHTVFNDFLMLSNTQFIENRVYDEEVEEAIPKPDAPEKQPEQEKTREQKEAELIPKVQEAVNYGLRVLESAFEQLDIKAGNSDSEDEETIERVEPILEPKDLYIDRPLPYLIGSQLFMEQDNVGLGDLSSEEMSIDSERDSVIDSEEEKGGDQSDEDFDQDDVGQNSFKKKSSLSDEEVVDDEDEDSDIFGDSDKEDDEEGKKISTGSSSFADELAARIRGETPSKPEGEHSVPPSITSKKRSKVQKDMKAVEEERDELFQPPSMEDTEHSPFGSKGGLFSGGRGLFDDDDEGDLFSEAPKQDAEEGSSKALVDDETVLSKHSKKIPAGAVSIFPGNSLFGSPQDSDSSESKESRSSAQQKVQSGPKSAPSSGLFDDDEDDDDFFSGSTFKKSSSAGLEKHKQNKVLDLFGAGEDDEEGDIFNENFNSVPSGHSKKKEENVNQVPQKKLPAGATSMFNPGTTSLLQDAVRRRQPSIGDESQMPKEDVAPINSAKTPIKSADKPQARGLFSDDEDSQIFSSPTKNQPKQDPSPQIKPSKAPLSIFDDEEEQDLFASAPVNLKTSQAKNDTLQKSSSLFSDDEDQWMSSVSEGNKPVAKTGGTKSSSKEPAVKAPEKNSLFDDDDNSDLFAATKETSKKKQQRVSLLFEDEDEGDEDKGSLFNFKPSSSDPTPTEKTASMRDNERTDTSGPVKEQTVEVPKHPQNDSSKAHGQPAGAVSLFGGIDVLRAQQTATKISSSLGDTDQAEGPPPMEDGPKPKKTVLSLFDDDDDDDGDDDDNDNEQEDIVPTTTLPKILPKKTLKPQEQRSSTASTRVFQDEELLFSQTQQKDNDPDVDLFAPPGKSASPKASSVRPAATALFGEDDNDDSFVAARPKVAQKPAVSIKSKEPSSRIGKLQVNLAIDPSSLLPGAVPRIPGSVSALHHPSQSTLFPPESLPTLSSNSASGSTWERGVSFDTPAQVTTLQSANKTRAKGAGHRRPQTRAARLAAQQSDSNQLLHTSQPPVLHAAARPTELVLPEPTHVERVPSATEDTFNSDNLCATNSKKTPNTRTLEKALRAAPEKNICPSIFDSHGDDDGNELFQAVKQTPAKKTTTVPFLDDDEEDLFAVKKGTDTHVTKDNKMKAGTPERDIFQDEVDQKKIPRKTKERTVDASLFDDDIDIFADLTATTTPIEKKLKKKVETKSIFDDDMDDIFSSVPVKPVTKQVKSKRSAPAQDPSSSLFDDPLNALGGK